MRPAHPRHLEVRPGWSLEDIGAKSKAGRPAASSCPRKAGKGSRKGSPAGSGRR